MRRSGSLSPRLCLFVAVFLLEAQTTRNERLPTPSDSAELHDAEGGRLWRYRAPKERAVHLNDSPRLETLVRAGNLYLSLREAIALAIENNLDVEYQRLTPLLAEADILRTKSGAIARGIPSNIQEGPSGVGSGTSSSAAAGSGGTGVQSAAGISGNPSTASQANLSNNLTNGTSVPTAGPQTTASGPALPPFDPALVGAIGWNRTNRPQTNTFITGTNALTSTSLPGNLTLQKGFGFGGVASLGYDTTRQNTNNLRSDINPATTSGLSFQFAQPLLQGFGFAVNNRYIRIAKNNRHVSDLLFEQQLLVTVYTTIRLYWDLVDLAGEVRVQQQSLDLAERLLSENRQQEEAGTLAPIDVVRTRAEAARARRDLTVAQTRVRQQETVLKDYLTRGAVDSALLAGLRVIPTEAVTPPAREPIRPLQDLVADARRHRPDLVQAEIQVDNSRIAMTGSRNALLPTLDLVVNGRTNALYGSVSSLPQPAGSTLARAPDPGFLGGIGTGLTQVFNGRFADYGAQVQLNIPLLNRGARADYARDRVALSQQQIRVQQLEKQVRVDVVNAQIAVEQSRAAYESARESREFQEQSLEAERQKYSVGVSTNYLVIQYQRDLAQAQSTEIGALTDYAKAHAALDRATGVLLDKYGISVVDAYRAQLPH